MKLTIRARREIAINRVRNIFSSRRPQLSILTDFGNDGSPYSLKSAAKFVNPKIDIAYICNEVPPRNILVGAHRLWRAVEEKTEYSTTAYVAVVDPGVGTKRKGIIVQTKTGKYLVGPDNGLLSLAFKSEGVERAVSIENMDLTLLHLANSSTFHGRDVFAPVAAHLLRGVPIEEFGELLAANQLITIKLDHQQELGGYILDVDGVSALRTTLPNANFESYIGQNVRFKIINHIRTVDDEIAKIVRTFADAKNLENVLVLSSTGRIDLAVNNGEASKKFNFCAADLGLSNFKPDTQLLIAVN